jgi:hypothetical protein
MLMLTHTDTYESDVVQISSAVVVVSSSEGVDMMLTQSPVKLLSVLVPKLSGRGDVRLP